MPKRIVASPSPDEVDRRSILQGVALALCAAFAFTISISLIKEVGTGLPTAQIVLFRMGIALLLMLPLVFRAPRSVMITKRPARHLYRILAGGTSMVLIYWAAPRMPLADLAATQFVMPLFLTVLSAPLLKEAVGWRRATATVIGFCGVLVMLRPSGAGWINLDAVYLVALASAFLYALAAVAIRQLGATEPALRTTVYFSAFATVASGVVCLFDWVDPTPRQLLLMISTGVAGGLGQFAFVAAYARAPATVVAPFDYTTLIWAGVLGFFVFGETPSANAVMGALIIAAAGMYIFHREARRRSAVVRNRI